MKAGHGGHGGARSARSAVTRLAGAATLGFALAGVAALLFTLRHAPVLGTDALLYHLPMATWWLQDGWLADVDLPFHGGGIEHGPALSQTIHLLLLRLAGDDGLCWLVQPACLLALALVFRRSARLAGASRPAAAGLAGLVLFFPPFFVNAQLQNNDLLLTLGVALALHGLLLVRRRATAGAVVLGLGLGVALATKATAVLLALALAPFAAVALARAPRDRRLAVASVVGLALALLGGGFLLRTWALHGNPLWPGQVRVLGVTLFEGLYDFSGFLDLRTSPAAVAATLVAGPEQHALAPPWSALLWLGWAAALVGLRRAPRVRSAAPLLFPLAAFALLFALVPGAAEEPRYHLPVFYGLWLALALGLASLGRLDRRRLGPALALVAPTFLVARLLADGVWHEPWVVAGVLGAAVAVALQQAPRGARRRAPWVALAGVALTAASGPLWYPGYRAARDAVRNDRRVPRYGARAVAWAHLDRLSRERPLVVAYAGTGLVQPLFGPRLRNRVVYLRLSPDDRPAPLVFGPPPRPPGIHVMPLRVAEARRRRVAEAFWLEQVERARVDVLLLADDPLRGGSAPERALVARHPERFRPLWSGEGVWLVEVRRR